MPTNMPFNTKLEPPSPDDAKPDLNSFAEPATLKDHQSTGAAFEFERKKSQVPNRAKWPRHHSR